MATVKLALIFLAGVVTAGAVFYVGTNASGDDPAQQIIVKNDTTLIEQVESAPFVWDGELKYLITRRAGNASDAENTLEIFDFASKTQISTFGRGLNMASAIVHDGQLHVIATKDTSLPLGRSTLYHMISPDLVNFTPPPADLFGGAEPGSL